MSEAGRGRDLDAAPAPGFTAVERLWILALLAVAAVFLLFLLQGGVGNSSYDWLLLGGIVLNLFSIASFFARRHVRRAERRLEEHRRRRRARR